MKGTRSFPQCGFSASVVNILNTLVPKYTTVNILSDADIRGGMKEYSDWPTFPQLFIKGEFVGGADIVRQMHEAGELEKKLGDLVAPAKAPTVTVTARAAAELGGRAQGRHARRRHPPDDHAELGAPARPRRRRKPSHVTIETGGITVQLDRPSAAPRRGRGDRLHRERRRAAASRSTTRTVRRRSSEIAPKELKALLDSGKVKAALRRPQREGARDRADRAARSSTTPRWREIEKLPKDTPLAFHCHHGDRSRVAAEHFLKQGFKNVYNLAGGIDAWSRDVDPSVPQY